MPQFTMIKTGSFIVKNQSLNQCKDVGFKEFNYEVVLCCGDKLDENGWLIDNMEVAKVVKSTGRKADSCEVMSKNIALALIKATKKHGTVLKHIKVSISPNSPDVSTKMIYEEFDIDEHI